MIFLDTTILLSAGDKSDGLHADGAAVLNALAQGRLSKALTTDFILDETLTLLRRRGLNASVISDAVESIRDSKKLKILYVDEELFADSLMNFRKYERFSFTDAVSYTVMKKFRIREIYTHDHDFDLKGIVRKERPS